MKALLALAIITLLAYGFVYCLYEEACINERKAILQGDGAERKKIKLELAEELYQEAHRRAKKLYESVPKK